MSAPVKRKRADSSASTAAANVLLQVASSANASPKGDWTMDFNGHDNGIALQPQSVIFGYQPTMNTSMTHDPFGYYPSGSGPTSQFASRAPSPTQDFDAPFDTVSPGPSIFAFLFKDSLKLGLPSIGTILPRIRSQAQYSDYHTLSQGHRQAPEHNNLFSHFRGPETLGGTSASLTRPSSPNLCFPDEDLSQDQYSLEHKPLVAQLTEEDRVHLSSYTQTSLPSARLLNLLVQLYFENFHGTMPILHAATYSPCQSEQILTLAILTIGSHYWADRHSDMHRVFRALCKRVLRGEPDTFAGLQAQVLLDVAELCDAESQVSMEAVEDRRSGLLRRARAKKLFDENYDDSPREDASIEARWQILRRAEERRRLSWALYVYDFHFSMLFDVRPLLDANEVKTSLPCHESLWDADSAESWASQFAPDRLPLRTRTLWSTGRLEERGLEGCSAYGAWCRSILAYVEARRVHSIASAVPQVGDPHTESDTQRALRLDAETLLANANSMANQAFDILNDLAVGQTSAGSADPSFAMLSLNFARLATSIDFQAIRQLLFGDDRAIRSWATSLSSARRATLLASHVLSQLSQDQQNCPFAGLIMFYALLTLICYSRYCARDESQLEPLELDKTPINSPQAVKWVDEGAYIATVNDVGILENDNVDRILQAGIRFSRNVVWGRATIEKRMETLVEFSSYASM